MPFHDWSRVETAAFHDFHTSWLVCFKSDLDNGGLPDGYFARVERHAGRPASELLDHAAWTNGPVTVAVRRDRTKRLAAVVEIGTSWNPASADGFVRKIQTVFRAGVHVFLLDILPVTSPPASGGLTDTVCMALNGMAYSPPGDKPLGALSCCAGPNDFYIHPLAVGDELPDVPLFLTPDVFVDLPLAATYAQAFQSMPPPDRRLLTS